MTTELDLDRALRPLVRDLKILSLREFVYRDQEIINWEKLGFYRHGVTSLEETLVCALQGFLYNVEYSRCRSVREHLVEGVAKNEQNRSATLDAFLSELQTHDPWDDGWRIVNLTNSGSAVLEKEGWRRVAEPGSWSNNTQSGQGGYAWLKRPQPHPDSEGTFYYLYGAAAGDGLEQGNRFRLYFNTDENCAQELVSFIVKALDDHEVPFVLKTLRRPKDSKRVDSTILYASRKYHSLVLRLIGGLSSSVLVSLGEATPLFSLPLERGIAVAEDPSSGESFGMNRMRLVAEVLVQLWREGVQDEDARLGEIRSRFEKSGLRFEFPHLEEGSSINYAECWRCVTGQGRTKFESYGIAPGRESFLEAAKSIGRRLCREALWEEDRCAWQGWSVVERGEALPVCWRTFGADLYRGSSGISLFLAHLFRFKGDEILRATAIGGIDQSFVCMDEFAPLNRLGFYTGIPGVAYAAMNVGELLDEPRLVEQGLACLESLSEIELEKPMFDVVSGVSGSIPFLIHSSLKFGRKELLDLAVRYGHWLLENAVECDGTNAWVGGSEAGAEPLCGHSHGASGVSLALMELYQQTKETKFMRAGLKGLAYERRHFDKLANNWADLRLPANERSPATTLAWCHGAPGIGLSRLRIAEILPSDNEVKEDLNIALETTSAHLKANSEIPLGNFSLCHGAFGNAELLLLAARQLKSPGLEVQARQIGKLGIEKIMSHSLDWPSGLPEQKSTPGLMLGDAGIGLSYLRLCDPVGVPSILRM